MATKLTPQQQVKANPSAYYKAKDGSTKAYGGGVVIPAPGSSPQQSSAETSSSSSVGSATDYLSPSEAISYANLVGEGSAIADPVTQAQVDAERARLSGIYRPYYAAANSALDSQAEIAKQQGVISKAQIADSYDAAFKNLQEGYNRRGLYFSGQELNQETLNKRDKANSLTSAELNLQNTLSTIGTNKAQLTLKEQQDIEEALSSYVKNQSSINDSVAQAKAKSTAAALAASMLGGITNRIATDKQTADSYKASAEERANAALTGVYQGQPTLAGMNYNISAERLNMAQQLQPYKVRLAGLSVQKAQAALANTLNGSGNNSDYSISRAMVLSGAVPYSTIASQIPSKQKAQFNQDLFNDWKQANPGKTLGQYSDAMAKQQKSFKSNPVDDLASQLGIDLGTGNSSGDSTDYSFMLDENY